MDRPRRSRLRGDQAAELRAAGRREGRGRDRRRPPVHHAVGRAELALRAARARGRAAADALRAARVAVRQPALLAAGEPGPPAVQTAGESVQPGRRGARRRGLPLRRDDVPADRAPHRRGHVALRALPLRAAARDVLRDQPRARSGSGARARRLGDDLLVAGRDRGACPRHRSDPAARGPRAQDAPGRPAVPLGLAGPDHRRRRQRPRADRARPERAHPGGEGVLGRNQARAATAWGEADRVRGRAEATGGRGMTTPAAWPDTYGDEAQERVGFFTDTSVCIGCKACEVACKEWNLVPEDGMVWTGESYDNTSELGANTWRHVAFIEQNEPLRVAGAT